VLPVTVVGLESGFSFALTRCVPMYASNSGGALAPFPKNSSSTNVCRYVDGAPVSTSIGTRRQLMPIEQGTATMMRRLNSFSQMRAIVHFLIESGHAVPVKRGWVNVLDEHRKRRDVGNPVVELLRVGRHGSSSQSERALLALVVSGRCRTCSARWSSRCHMRGPCAKPCFNLVCRTASAMPESTSARTSGGVVSAAGVEATHISMHSPPHAHGR